MGIETLAIAGAAASAGGGLLGAYGTWKQGESELDLAREEANMLRVQAGQAIEQGDEQAALIRDKGKVVEGQQKVSYAAQGVLVGTGSSGQVMEDTAQAVEADARTAKLNAAREAWSLRKRATIREDQGEAAYRAARLNAIGGVLGTGGKMMSGFGGM